MDVGEVRLTLLELAGTGGNKVCSGQWLGEVWDKKSSLYEVKGKNGFNTMHHEEGRVSS